MALFLTSLLGLPANYCSTQPQGSPGGPRAEGYHHHHHVQGVTRGATCGELLAGAAWPRAFKSRCPASLHMDVEPWPQPGSADIPISSIRLCNGAGRRKVSSLQDRVRVPTSSEFVANILALSSDRFTPAIDATSLMSSSSLQKRGKEGSARRAGGTFWWSRLRGQYTETQGSPCGKHS